MRKGIVLFADFHVGAAAFGDPQKYNASLGFGPPRGAAPTADLRIKCALGHSLEKVFACIRGRYPV